MTILAEKLKEAGADTIGAQLTAACTQAARLHPNDPEAAWRSVGISFGHAFIRGIMTDMSPAPGPERQLSARSIDWKPMDMGLANASVRFDRAPVIKPYQPKVIAPERLEKRRELRNIVRSKYKNSGDVAWSDVGWHELHALKRDGVEAQALLADGPANVPNDGRSVGDVLGVKRIDEIIKRVRS